MDIADVLANLGIPAFAVTIEPYLGATATGHAYGTTTTVEPCWVDNRRRVVKDSTGAEVTSTATVYAPLATACPDRSRITLPDGRSTVAISVARRDGGGLPVPEHVEITCE